MPITLQLANQVLRLRRRNMSVELMAAELNRTEAEILDAHGMLGIAITDLDEEPPGPHSSDAERAAARANWPMKWQQRYEKRKR